ncbi:DUF3221 domain-containing protein [Saccharibacillus endophyticus]|uniref:DUF3221 domain-containing protein n=1 Tax=Saccharibacillus endophyticus TaxID=2060666 RepID=A0ABQ2A1K9_9BACL|nr:DUF3221 domain-containing protein [Saccharibacillus endophyticus]GGH82408.1 hypothetical protein GCM10007362_33680 [Saccharibacillus endophyticus]
MDRHSVTRNGGSRISGLGIAALTLLFAAGCAFGEPRSQTAPDADPQAGQNAGEEMFPVGGGYVVDVGEQGVLVVSPEKQDYSATGGDGAYYEATYYSDAPEADEVKVGMYVNVWMAKGSTVMTSDPGQAKAARIEIEDEVQPEGAELTRSEAIRRALEESDIGEYAVPAVSGADYDAKQRLWFVKLLDHERKPVTVEIKDERSGA